MDKIKTLRTIIKKIYPGTSIIVRSKKNKKFQILLKDVKETFYDPETLERKIRFKNNKVIIIDSFRSNIESFYPFFTKENSEVTIIMWDGKINKI